MQCNDIIYSIKLMLANGLDPMFGGETIYIGDMAAYNTRLAVRASRAG